MIRTYLSNDYIKRTVRPLFAWTQATPKPAFLDPNWTRAVPVWPGMGFIRTGGDLVTLAGANSVQMNGATMAGAAGASNNGSTYTAGALPVYGLGALYVGGDGIDELLYAGINAFSVWVLGPDAEFEILAPAFDPTATWADPTDGSGASLIGVACQTGTGTGRTAASLQGQLVPWSSSTSISAPVARLLKVNSSTKITIGGLEPYSAALLASTSASFAAVGRD